MNVSQYPTPIILTKLNSDLTFIYSIVLLRSDSVKLKFTYFHSILCCKILLTTCLVSCFYLYPNVPTRVFVFFCLTKCFCFYDLQLLIVSCVIRIFRLCPIQSKPLATEASLAPGHAADINFQDLTQQRSLSFTIWLSN